MSHFRSIAAILAAIVTVGTVSVGPASSAVASPRNGAAEPTAYAGCTFHKYAFTGKVVCSGGNIVYPGTQFRAVAKCNITGFTSGPWVSLNYGTSETTVCLTGVEYVAMATR